MGFYADITCGPACWEAREDVCRCSCSGARHGVLRGDGVTRPRRECKIAGKRYVLAGVGDGWGSNPLNAWGREEREAIRGAFGVTYGSTYVFIPENLTVSRLASEAQSDNWPECPRVDGRRQYLYWIREDAAPMFAAWQERLAATD